MKPRSDLPVQKTGENRQIDQMSIICTGDKITLDISQKTTTPSTKVKRQAEKIIEMAKSLLNLQDEEKHQETKNKNKTIDISATLITALLPPEYPFIIRHADYACAGKKFCIDLNLLSKQEFLLWLKRHEAVAGVKYIPKTLQDHPFPAVVFKGLYQCDGFRTEVNERYLHDTPCSSTLKVTILSNVRQAGYKDEKYYPTQLTIKFNHNHKLRTIASAAVEQRVNTKSTACSRVESRFTPPDVTRNLIANSTAILSPESCHKSTEVVDKNLSALEKRQKETEVESDVVSLRYEKPSPEVIELVDSDVDEQSFRDLLMIKVKTLQESRASEVKIDMICIGKDDYRIGILFLSTLQHALRPCRILFIHRVRITENYDVILVFVDNASKKFPLIAFITSTDAMNLSTVILKDLHDTMTNNGLNVDKVEVIITDMPFWKLQINNLFSKAVVSTSVHLIMFDVWSWLWKNGNLVDMDNVTRCSLFSVICQLFNATSRKYFDGAVYTNVLRNIYMRKCSKFLEYFTNEILRFKDHVFTSDVDNKNTVDFVSRLLSCDVILLTRCEGDVMTFLDMLVKYLLNEKDALNILKEKINSFNIVEVNQNYCSVRANSENVHYIVDKKFGFCSCQSSLEGWHCIHRRIVLYRRFRQDTNQTEISSNNIESNKSVTVPPIISQRNCNVQKKNSVVPKRNVKIEPPSIEIQPSVEVTKRKLYSVVDILMGKWNDSSKHNIAKAVQVLHDSCSPMTPNKICLQLGKI